MKKKLDNILAAVMAVVLLGLMLVYFDANLFHYTRAMEADVASDALLIPVLYENGFIQPKSWCASAEICIISAPNLGAFLYPLVGYNMNLAMGLACCIMTVVMMVLMYLYLRNIGLSRAESILPLLLVFSLIKDNMEIRKMLVLYAAYYVSHLITLFIVLLFYNKCLRDNKVNIVGWIATTLLAILNGLQGMHACLFCYVPLLGVEIIRRFVAYVRKDKQSDIMIFVWTLWVTVTAYLSTKILESFNLGPSRNIRHALQKFVEEVWPCIQSVVCFESNPVLVTIFLAVAAVGFGITCVKLLGKDRVAASQESLKWGTCTTVISFVICVMADTFTTVDVTSRYFLMLVFAMGIGNALFMHYINSGLKYLLPVVAAIFTAFAIADNYDSLVISDDSQDAGEYKVAQWMQESGYEYGYGTFDFANYITVMSNNAVKVRAVSNLEDMAGLKWLTDATWYPPYKSTEGKTCYVVTQPRMEDFGRFMERYNPEVIEVKEIDKFIIYVLDHDYTLWER